MRAKLAAMSTVEAAAQTSAIPRVSHYGSSEPMAIWSAVEACSGSTPLPSAVICWLAVKEWPGAVTHPGGRPMTHSTNSGDGLGPALSLRRAGAGAGRPVMCSQRAMASA